MADPPDGFRAADDRTLKTTRRRLERTLGRVLAAGRDGTLDVRRKPGGATLRESGYTALILLEGVEKELARRHAERAGTPKQEG